MTKPLQGLGHRLVNGVPIHVH
eukprot:COSAG05_NODE_5914_length_1060_cov_1.210198_1_plen_21_part_01